MSTSYVPLFYAAANSLELRPIIAAIQDLSQSCASLDIVQASVMATLDYNPNWPPSMAVRQAICNLAASEHTDEVASERTVQAALERIEQAALERTEQAASERTDQVASERTDQAASERNTQGDSHMR
jgi:phage-related tail fiber protein